MGVRIEYELCPETGIGCLMLHHDTGMTKIDLMPDEAADLRTRVQSGDMDGARELLAGIDSGAEAALREVDLVQLTEAVAR